MKAVLVELGSTMKLGLAMELGLAVRWRTRLVARWVNSEMEDWARWVGSVG